MGSKIEAEGLSLKVESEKIGLQSSINHQVIGEKDDLFSQLWHICAGPLASVPRAGDEVFYFLQGHTEQIKAFANQVDKVKMPVYNLPYKIPCKVVNVQLKAEAGTDQVFAQITLLPLKSFQSSTSGEPSLKEETSLSMSPSKNNAISFCKKLTPSDISTHGGFSVPKQLAEECFPPLDRSQDPPTQELVAKDVHGVEWKFRHIYRGAPKRNLLNNGWGSFVSAKKLVAGDVCIFLRGENGELYIGIRRATKPENNTSASIISGHSMQHGILAAAYQAISTGTMFTVFYHPRFSPEFIIPNDRFIKCAEKNYSVGMRFRMLFEGEKEQRCSRFAGTVVGIDSVDCTRWPNSEWKCLKVKWDNRLDTTPVRPERVSPWSIEPVELKRKKRIPAIPPRKRTRPSDASTPESSVRITDGILKSSVPEKHLGVFQGQEIKAIDAHKLAPPTQPSVPHLIPQPNADQGQMRIGLENQVIDQYPGGIVSFPGKNTPNSGLANVWIPMFTSDGIDENAEASGSLSVPNLNFISSISQNWKAPKDKDKIEASTAQPNGSKSCKLFGTEIFVNHKELPSPQATTSSSYSDIRSLCSVLYQTTISDPIQDSEPSEIISCNLQEKQCDKCSSTANWNCTKVVKFGSPFGRSIDLAHFGGYSELIRELDRMLEFNGTLIDGSSGWHVTYIDDDGDMMLTEGYPWQAFQTMVQKLFICPKEGVNRFDPTTLNQPPL